MTTRPKIKRYRICRLCKEAAEIKTRTWLDFPFCCSCARKKINKIGLKKYRILKQASMPPIIQYEACNKCKDCGKPLIYKSDDYCRKCIENHGGKIGWKNWKKRR